MAYVSEKLEELQAIKPQVTPPDDLRAFWDGALNKSAAQPLSGTLHTCDYPLPHVQVYDAEFAGMDGALIHAWYLVPDFTAGSCVASPTEPSPPADLSNECSPEGKYPCIVCFHGFTGNRGRPEHHLHWLLQGCCVLAVDVRGQSGTTADNHTYTTGLVENVMMQGLTSPQDAYIKFAYLDAVRAVEFARTLPQVDPDRVITEGGSQGGALSLAAAALSPHVFTVLCDIPSNCEIALRIERAEGSFSSVNKYLQIYPGHTDQVFDTVRYFDLVNLAPWVKCPVFAGVGLLDPICPARYFFAAYRQLPGKKQIEAYPFCGHGCAPEHTEKKLRYLQRLLG